MLSIITDVDVRTKCSNSHVVSRVVVLILFAVGDRHIKKNIHQQLKFYFNMDDPKVGRDLPVEKHWQGFSTSGSWRPSNSIKPIYYYKKRFWRPKSVLRSTSLETPYSTSISCLRGCALYIFKWETQITFFCNFKGTLNIPLWQIVSNFSFH